MINPVVHRLSLLAAWVVGLGSAWGQCQFETVYTTPAEPCPWPWSPRLVQPRGVSSSDTWVGFHDACPDDGPFGNGWTYPLIWDPIRGLGYLPLPAGVGSGKAEGINASGTIVGSIERTWIGRIPAIWKDGEIIEVPPVGGNPPHGEFTAINDAGTAVGFRSVGDYFHAIIWNNGKLSEIDPAQFGYTYSVAKGVAANGWISGTVFNNFNCDSRAFRLKDGRFELLEPLPGSVASLTHTPGGVTSRGWTLGYSSVQTGSPCSTLTTKFVYTLWTETAAIEVKPLPGYKKPNPWAMNDKGVLVGDCRDPIAVGAPLSPPTIWIDGEPHLLSEFYAGSGLTDQNDPVLIRADGEILMSGLVPVETWQGTTLELGVWELHPLFSTDADTNGDCAVNGRDLSQVLGDWGQNIPPSDLNHDGTVDGADIAVLLESWTG